MRKLITILLAAAVLNGCTLAPTYERPEAPIPETYGASSSTSSEGETPPAGAEFFTDAGMRRVIEIALENNRDLRVSMLNIESVRAQYQIQRSSLLPEIGGTGAATGQRTPA